MTFRKLYPAALLVAVILCGLHLYGAIEPGSMNWGFHFLGYLPPYALAAYLAAAALAMVALWRGWLDGPVDRAAAWCDRNPRAFLAAAVAGVLVAAAAFRIRAPLLGDSFTFIRNLTDAFDGTYPLGVWHEPLAMYFFYYALKALQSTGTAELIRAFVYLDALFGIVFVAALARIVRELVDDATERFLLFLWVLWMPTTVFFFGYVEIYGFTLMCLALYLWLSLLVLRRKVSFMFLPPALLVLVFLHYLNGLLGVSLLYLAYRELRERRVREVAFGVVAAAAGLLGILAVARFELGSLMDQSPISHFLSLTGEVSMFNAYSQAFTLFSAGHAVELLNFAILMFPLALFLLVFVLASDARVAASSARSMFLSTITFPYLALIAGTKIQQGMGNDWDVTAGYFVVFTLTSGVLLAGVTAVSVQTRRKVLLLAVSVTALHSFVWFSLDATIDANLRRVQGLFDRRMISQLGHYTIALHLSRYFDFRGDSLEQPALWERYASLYPGDPRGYENSVRYLEKRTGGERGAERELVGVYERWIAADPANAPLRAACADLCGTVGSSLFERDSVKAAITYFEKAVLLSPGSAPASNNLGGALARDGRIDLGVKFFRQAISLDSTFSDAYFNLAMAFEELGEERESLRALEKAAALGNLEAAAYLNEARARPRAKQPPP